MTDLHFATISGANTVVQEDIVNSFKTTFRGETLFPGDESYEEARKVWNGMINKRPALIARCTGVADVISAVNFARTHHLLVSVRGGGHNIPGNCVCDGGVVIDLSRMKGIRVDPGHRTVRAEGGVKWGELDRETQTFGLAVPGGTDADTGIAGLTLGGGIGWLSGKYGLACDNLISADVVTADGQFLTVSSNTDHADLFWALRGAVVTMVS
jgi:FAD/FMN-containing dehydrogenase